MSVGLPSEPPSEIKHLAAIINYVCGLEDRCIMQNGDPAKGELVITGKDKKAIQMAREALVFLQAHVPTIMRAIERDAEYANGGKRFGGAKR
jgi:hypothetical protein